jgi:hypothetical protein
MWLVWGTLLGCFTINAYPMNQDRDWLRGEGINAPYENWNCIWCRLPHHPEISCKNAAAMQINKSAVNVVINEMTSEKQRERERAIRDSDPRNR